MHYSMSASLIRLAPHSTLLNEGLYLTNNGTKMYLVTNHEISKNCFLYKIAFQIMVVVCAVELSIYELKDLNIVCHAICSLSPYGDISTDIVIHDIASGVGVDPETATVRHGVAGYHALNKRACIKN